MSHKTSPDMTISYANDQDQPHLLIVDDDPAQTLVLQAYMERQGYRVSAAYGGHQALALVYSERPDLVILDLTMPDLDGLAVCQRVKTDAALGYLPVIVVTDIEEQHKRLAGMLSGADDYLPKPVVEKDLLLRVQALLRTKGQIDRLIAENQILNESLRKRNTELERALEMVSQAEVLKNHIMENVNHEMRTPMLQIKTSVSMLVEVVAGLSRVEKDHTVARMATESVARMEELINNISQLYLVENLKLSPVVLNDAVNQSINSLRRSWSHRNEIERIKLILADCPPVIADRRAVTRILTLLLDNALKFSPQETRVEVRTSLQGKDAVRVSVKDRGIGIDPRYHEHIFEPFFQIDVGTKRRFNGVGVGLALAQMLAHAMNTHIQVESRLKRGSTFWFTLPVADLENPQLD
jgi:signal transduction histidine kinase